jgi:hypothetical protein
MVINDLDIIGAALDPAEAKAKLVFPDGRNLLAHSLRAK